MAKGLQEGGYMENLENLSILQLADELLVLAQTIMQAVKKQDVEGLKVLEARQRQSLSALKTRAAHFPKELDAVSKKKLQQYQLLNDQYVKELGKHYAVVHFDKPNVEISELIK
jgi:hypothetical protein